MLVGGATLARTWLTDGVNSPMQTNDDIRVESYCDHCAMPIQIELQGGRATYIDPAESLVYLALRPTEWWGDIVTTCRPAAAGRQRSRHPCLAQGSLTADRPTRPRCTKTVAS